MSTEKSNGGRWVKGQSGNPAGRRRTGMGLAHAIQRMVDPDKMVQFALDRLEKPGFAEKDRQWAMDWLRAAGFKAPAQVVEHAVADPTDDVDFEKMSDAELDAYIAEG